MRESLLKTEAKYIPDLDQSEDSDQSKNLDQSKDIDQSKDSDLDSESSDDVQKPKTNKFKCEACNQEITQKSYYRHNQSLKHKKNEQFYNRNEIIESAKKDGIKFTNEDIEQKLDKNYPELDGIKYCDSCDMYLDNNTEYNKHIETLKHKNNVRLFNGEIIKNGSKSECVAFKSTLSQNSVDSHLKTKLPLDNVKGKDKDITGDDNNNIASEVNNKN